MEKIMKAIEVFMNIGALVSAMFGAVYQSQVAGAMVFLSVIAVVIALIIAWAIYLDKKTY